MSNHEPGNLIFIPSNVRLLKYSEDKSFPINYKLTSSPMRALIIQPPDENKRVGIHYDGATWFVSTGDIAPGD